MSTWFEVKDKALNDPELKDKPVTERLKIAGERWRKITGKPKAPKKTKKNKKEKMMKPSKSSKHNKTQVFRMKSPCGSCNLRIEVSCE